MHVQYVTDMPLADQNVHAFYQLSRYMDRIGCISAIFHTAVLIIPRTSYVDFPLVLIRVLSPLCCSYLSEDTAVETLPSCL